MVDIFFSGILPRTELHWRTDFSKEHRGVKPTDNRERFSYCWVLGVKC